MSPASDLLCAFVLEKSVSEPITRRIGLYRALASTLSAATPRFRELTELADELEEVERRHRQLLIDLGEDGTTNGGAQG